MKDFVFELAMREVHRKASVIDEHLARFLTEKGFNCTPWTLEHVREDLKRGGVEIVYQVDRDAVATELHTFKLVKVLSSTALNIPRPEITLGNNKI